MRLPHHKKRTASVNNRAVECLCRCIGRSTRISSLEHHHEYSAVKRWIFAHHSQVGIAADLAGRGPELLADEHQQALSPRPPTLDIGAGERGLARPRLGGDKLFVAPNIARPR